MTFRLEDSFKYSSGSIWCFVYALLCALLLKLADEALKKISMLHLLTFGKVLNQSDSFFRRLIHFMKPINSYLKSSIEVKLLTLK